MRFPCSIRCFTDKNEIRTWDCTALDIVLYISTTWNRQEIVGWCFFLIFFFLQKQLYQMIYNHLRKSTLKCVHVWSGIKRSFVFKLHPRSRYCKVQNTQKHLGKLLKQTTCRENRLLIQRWEGMNEQLDQIVLVRRDRKMLGNSATQRRAGEQAEKIVYH